MPSPRPIRPPLVGALTVVAVLVAACSGSDGGDGATGGTVDTPEADVVLAVTDAGVTATLDPRFHSYNVEMVEVTGGEFWAPYDAPQAQALREPIALDSERLRNLARALGPAYIRVSGTRANVTYFDPEGTTGGVPPEGFSGVLTGDQWRGVGEFAEAVDGEIVTSFASYTGVRDAGGRLVPDQARSLLTFSVEEGIPLVAAELYNEPSVGIGAPGGYDGDDFARDLTTLQSVVDEVMPDLRLAGPGNTDDVTPLVSPPVLSAVDILDATGPAFDVFSYHVYPKVSERCGSTEGPEIGLTQDYLSRVDADRDHYEGLRDTYLPDAPMWVTETAQAACGGDRWAAQYLDVIRYVDNLGRLGRGDGDVVFHNTLAASDYGLIDEEGFEPRPNYWAALLWSRLMGPEVLAVEDAGLPDLAVHAHCTAEGAGPGVTYAVVNSSATEERTVATTTGEAVRYQLTGEALDGSTVALNGTELAAAEDGTVPEIAGEEADGALVVPPASVAFVVDPAGSAACG